MTAVLNQVKNVAYTGVGVNLVVTDAIIGREVPAPKAVTEHAATHLARYKLPKDYVLVDEIRRSASGKPDYAWAKRVAVSAGDT